MVPVIRAAWLLVLTLALSTLSGCIAAQDDETSTDDRDTTAGDDAHAGHTMTFDGPVAVEVLHTDSWSGPTTFDDTVSYDSDYDYLHYVFANSGQQSAPVMFTAASGEAMDEGSLASRNGAFTIDRIVPGDAGAASIASAGPVSGSGSLTLTGFRGVPPVSLLGVAWSGQTTALPVLGTSIGFHVPEGLDRVLVTLTGSGQAAPGLRIVDSSGNEVAALTAMSGSDAASTEAPATPGTWWLETDGMANGSFTVNVVALPT